MEGPPLAPPSTPLPPPPTLRSKSRRRFYLALTAAIAIVIALTVLVLEFEPGGPQNPYKVRVTEVNWLEDGSLSSSSPGFTKDAGKSDTVTLSLYCSPGLFDESITCQSGSVFIQTSGFGLQSTNAPYTWTSGSGGAYSTLSVTVSLPSTSYTGNLTINID